MLTCELLNLSLDPLSPSIPHAAFAAIRWERPTYVRHFLRSALADPVAQRE